MATLKQATRLCLAVTAEAGAAAGERLSAALAAGDIASVILMPGRNRPLDAANTRPLLAIAQQAGAAVLLSDDARLARTLKADGVHLSVSANAEQAYGEAREILGKGAIVGMDAGASRHDAMMLGEAGADYVGFGVPAGADEAVRAERLDLIDWWAEIFEPPCLALNAEAPDEVAELAAAGADFVAVRLSDGISLADAREVVMAYAEAIAAAKVG